jgi:cold-inducible RNA-binding protein
VQLNSRQAGIHQREEGTMAKNLFVGSLPWSVNDEQLAQIFAEAGTVDSARVITERDTGRSKGFGFVEMASDDEAKKAVETLNGKEIEGRAITVNEARPREER